MKNVIKNQIDVRADYQTHRGSIKNESGLTVIHQAKALFDTAGTDSAGVSNKTVAAHGTGVFLPAKAVITKAWYQVITAFTSTNSTATIAGSVQGANDLVTATAVSNAIFGTTGFKVCVPDGTIASFIQTSAEKEITFTVGVQALLLGKAMLYVDYTIAE